MLIQILLHTPAWVFGVLALLLFLGGRQLRPHRISLARATLMPLAMVALAVWGVVSAFGASPTGPLALLVWAGLAALAALYASRRPLPPAVRYDAATQSLQMPGSALPLTLMMLIFATKYGVAVFIALHPQWAQHSAFSLAVSALYGLFSGVFAGRALRLWKRVLGAGAAAPASAHPR